MSTEIKKVILEVDGKEIVLTVAGAKKLKELLGELFGRDIVRETTIINRDTYVPTYPYPYKPYWGLTSPVYCSTSDKYSTATFKAADNALLCKVTS